MAVQANENGQELFNVIEDAKTFAEEVKSSLKTLRTGDYFWFVAPLYFFLDVYKRQIQSTARHVKPGRNTGGPPSNPKYYPVTDSV